MITTSRRWPLSVFVTGAPVVIVGCLAARLWTAAHAPYTDLTHLFPTHLRLDSLASGVGLAAAVRVWPGLLPWGMRHRPIICVVAVVAFSWAAFIPVVHPWSHTFGLTVLAGGGVAAVLAAAEWRPSGGFARSSHASGEIRIRFTYGTTW
jgi:hypothetical protein